MNDPRDNNVLHNFTRLFGGGDVLVSEIAMEILDVLSDLEGLLIESGRDVDQVLADVDALATWSDAEPETRSAVLLNLAWQTRETYQPADDGGAIAMSYATDLHRYASTFTGDDTAFHGNAFPAMPLPGQAGALSSSIGFDRDELAISLEIAVRFPAAVHAHQPH